MPGYRLIEKIGEGGSSQVWSAVGPGGFAAAIKFIRLPYGPSDVDRRNLEILRRVHHPNVVTAFGSWLRERWIIIALERADGSLWDRYLEAVSAGHPGIPRVELLGYLDEAARGIDYLNRFHHMDGEREGLGIQHRDLKPQNILVFGGGVKLADFGAARWMEDCVTGFTGKNLTLAYTPPEFFAGITSRHSDQYSLAVTYCHLRGGRLPFAGSAAAVTAGHLLQAPDLSMLDECERPAVARALHKVPEYRWPNCRSFVESLRADVEAAAEARPAGGIPDTARTEELPVAPSEDGSARQSAVTGSPEPQDEPSAVDPAPQFVGHPRPERRRSPRLAIAAALLLTLGGVAIGSGVLLRETKSRIVGRIRRAPLDWALDRLAASSTRQQHIALRPAIHPPAPIPHLDPVPAIPLAPEVDPREEILERAGAGQNPPPQEEVAAELTISPAPPSSTPNTETVPGVTAVESEPAASGESGDILENLPPVFVESATSPSPFAPADGSIASLAVLTEPATVGVKAGGEANVRVEVRRTGRVTGRAEITFGNVPVGVTIAPLTIPEDQDSAIAVVRTDFSARNGGRIEVRAEAGSVRAEGAFTLDVQPISKPGSLRLITPGSLEITAGQKVTFPIRLTRRDRPGPVEIRFERLPEGMTAPRLTIPADRSEANAELATSPEFADDHAEIRAVANTGAVDTESTIQLLVHPSPAIAQRRAADEHLRRGEFQQAIDAYSKAIGLNASDSLAYEARGRALAESGDRGRALADFDAALRLKPDFARAYRSRSELRYGNGDITGALADIEQALRLRPEDHLAWNTRGVLFASRGEPQKAIADFDESIRLKPDDAAAHFNRGWVYATLDDTIESIIEFDAAIRLNPRLAMAFQARGDAFAKRGDMQRSKADHDEATRLSGTSIPGPAASAPQPSPPARPAPPYTRPPSPSPVQAPPRRRGLNSILGNLGRNSRPLASPIFKRGR